MKLIALSKGFVARVDDDMYDMLSKFHWHANISKHGDCVYARRQVTEKLSNGKRKWKVIYMHQVVFGGKAEEGSVIDHIDNDTLNNTKENLRIVSASSNAYNRKIYKQRDGDGLKLQAGF